MNYTALIKSSRLLWPCLIILIATSSAICDVIHLKTGGKVEGVIVSEKGGIITVDIGFGTTTVDTADIASIERSSTRDQNRLEKSQTIPPILKPFMEGMHHLRSLRFKAVKRKRDLDILNHEIDSIEKILNDISGDYVTLREDLSSAREKGIYAWREQRYLISQAHEYNASILECQQQLEEKKRDKKGGNRALITYLDSLAIVDHNFNALKKSDPVKTNKNIRPALADIEKDLKKFNAEFQVAAIDVTFISGNHIIVPVKINGKRPVALLLDTGASSVVLSRSLAKRLGINWSRGREIEVTLANGEKTKGNLVTLHSVAVEEFRADNIRATVLEKPPAPGIDGLLGMSYLDRFLIHIDAVNRKLVLRHFKVR